MRLDCVPVSARRRPDRIHERSLCPTLLAGLVSTLLLAGTVAAATPDWVERNGVSDAYPASRYLVGFAQAKGREEALESAKQQAAADLARQVSVQIESSVVDVTREKQGRLENDLTSRIRATSEIQLEGIRFETHRKRKDVWVLATLERLPAAAARRRERDRALALTRRCLENAEREESAGRTRQALQTYRSCRTPLEAALEHEAIAAALQRGALLNDEAGDQLAAHAARIDARVRALPTEDARSIRSAADALAVQLARAGVGRGRTLQVAPLLYQGRDVSSPFGRELALAVESAIGRGERGEAGDGGPLVVRGTYREEGDGFQIRVHAKEARSGRLVGSAEIQLAGDAVPKGMETRPANFDRFVEDADKLAGGDVVSGDLRVEFRTNAGDRGLVFDEGDTMRLYVRVNQPAWVRLVYVLTSGHHIPITQGWYIDESQVNQLVEYPDSFEIVAPFGVEMIHAMASTEKPPRLVTRRTTIEGEPYVIIPDGADQVVRTRGIARKARRQVAEQTLKLTTMRKPR